MRETRESGHNNVPSVGTASDGRVNIADASMRGLSCLRYSIGYCTHA